jgi:hypothetical protein
MSQETAALLEKKARAPLVSGLAQHAAVRSIAERDLSPLSPAGASFAHDLSQVPAHAAQAGAERTVAWPLSPRTCPFGGACHTCPARVQAKLAINQPGDESEQEADRVAGMVMRMPEPDKDEEETCRQPGCAQSLQRQATDAVAPDAVPPIVHDVLRSPGQPLDAATRAFMEPRFGQDFSGVRVHNDRTAAESARAVNARAYAVRSRIAFGEGQYAPGTSAGNRLIAHELVHVIQQRQASHESTVPATLQANSPGDTAEQRTDQVHSEVLTASDFMPSCPTAQPSILLQRNDIGQTPTSLNPDVSHLPVGLGVDRFTSVYYDIDYRHEGGNYSNWLTVCYSDGTVIDISVHDIGDETLTGLALRNAIAQGYVGPGGRVFPKLLNRSTVPRLWQAKRSAIQAMEEAFYQFLVAATPAVLFIITVAGTARVGGPQQATRTAITRAIVRRAAPNVLDETLRAALRPNTLRHIFGQARHGLDPLVTKLGSEEAVMRQVVSGLGRTSLPEAGRFEVAVNVLGRNVTVRGAVVNGIPRVGTMFIKP